jgi:chromosome segregation ATPase
MFRRGSTKLRFGGSDITFVPANPSLDIMVQARENLNAFKAYLEHDPPDSWSHYDVVAQTMSRACSEFTNRTAQLEIKIDHARSAATDIEIRWREIVQKRADYLAQLEVIEAEETRMGIDLSSLQAQISAIESQLAILEQQERQLAEAREEHSVLESKYESAAAEYEAERAQTKVLMDEQALLLQKTQQRDTEQEAAFRECEERVRHLAAMAKAAEERAAQAATPRKKDETPAGPPGTPAFVIQDTVRVSSEEIERLGFMVGSLEADNARLALQVNSRMQDIDCLMQENLGLKQIIRELADGH